MFGSLYSDKSNLGSYSPNSFNLLSISSFESSFSDEATSTENSSFKSTSCFGGFSFILKSVSSSFSVVLSSVSSSKTSLVGFSSDSIFPLVFSSVSLTSLFREVTSVKPSLVIGSFFCFNLSEDY